MSKRFKIIALLTLCLLLLQGCGASKVVDPDRTCDLSDIGAASQTETLDDTQIELDILRGTIAGADCVLGIAFVDHISGELSDSDTAIWLQHSTTIAEYPFLADITTIAYSGTELFLLVPADKDAILTIFPAVINDEGELEAKRDSVIYKSEAGEPIALRCNINQGYSNVFVSLESGRGFYEFQPTVSLRDGWSVAVQDRCCDISVDNICKYIDSVYYMLPLTYPELQEAIDAGKILRSVGEFYFGDQMMIRFELGSYSCDGESSEFVWEKQYAVSFDATYAMDITDHKWYLIGTGLKGLGLKK